MKRLLTVIILVVLLLVIAYISKPSDESLKEKSKGSIKEFFETKLKNSAADSLLGKLDYGDEVINQASQSIKINDKFLYKEVTIPIFNYRNFYVIGYGAFWSFISTKNYRHIKVEK